jgi:multiple sugar transport system permease protein
MFLGSLRAPGFGPPDGFELIPPRQTLEPYSIVFLLIPLWRQLLNSGIVVLAAVPITVLFASWAGFAIVNAGPTVRKRLIVFTVVAQMVPLSAVWVPRFALFKWLGLTDSLGALIAPAFMATSGFYVLIFALAYYRIPRDIFSAAALDGWSPFQVWRQVAFPLAAPAAFAVAVLAFVAHWSNFIDPLLYLSNTDLYTVPLGLRALQTLEPQNFSILLAGAVIATVPAVVAFLFAQRAFFTKTLEVG